VFYSFQRTGLSPPWVSLFLGFFLIFGANVNGTVFLIHLSATSLLEYRNATDFYILILHPATLLNSFISSSCFLVKFIYSIMPSANRESLTSSLPIWMPYISFSCLIAMARTFSTVMNKSSENGHSYHVPDLRGKALFFTIEYDVSCWFSYMAFIMLRYVPSKPLLRVFILNRCCTLSNVYPASVEMMKWFLSFLLLM